MPMCALTFMFTSERRDGESDSAPLLVGPNCDGPMSDIPAHSSCSVRAREARSHGRRHAPSAGTQSSRARRNPRLTRAERAGRRGYQQKQARRLEKARSAVGRRIHPHL